MTDREQLEWRITEAFRHAAHLFAEFERAMAAVDACRDMTADALDAMSDRVLALGADLPAPAAQPVHAPGTETAGDGCPPAACPNPRPG